jgi:dipeptidyl aminopeptidase/acylaminoacyl peptidase
MKRIQLIRCAVLLAPLFALNLLVASDPTVAGWTIEETMKVRMVGHVRIAADGKRVLYTVRTAILEGDKGRYLTQIFTANIEGTNERALTGTDYSATHPEWSPDGRWIAFAADRSGRGDGNTLWIVSAGGGEPRAIDVGGTEVSTLKWSPDGKRLAFTMPAPLTPAQAEARAHPEAPQVIDADQRSVRLWTIGLTPEGTAQGQARALSSAQVSVRTDLEFGAPYDWAPDGSVIVFSWVGLGGNWFEHWASTGISIVNTTTGETSPLVPSGAMAPLFSPDGKRIAYLGSAAPFAAHSLDVQIIDVRGGPARRLAQTFDRHPTLVGWAKDGGGVYVHEARGTLSRITTLPLSGAGGVDVDAGDALLANVVLDPARKRFGFVRQTMATPMEVHVATIAPFASVQVSRANAALPSHPLPRTELLRWKSTDGAEIEGLLIYPRGYASGRRYPLVVAVRSGSVSFPQAFIANPFQEDLIDYFPVTELALRGFAVLQCNSRGGVLPGYGPAHSFPWAKPKDKSQADVMAGVDRVVLMGVADNDRVGIAGLSNGGMVAAWMITQTRRFKAAIVQSGIPDLVPWAAVNPAISHDLGAVPWDDVQPFREHSALYHLGAAGAATLILHGERDQPVPITQAYVLYRALKRRGVSTEMVVYPGEGHPVNAPKHLVDIGRRHVEWMTKYLQ